METHSWLGKVFLEHGRHNWRDWVLSAARTFETKQRLMFYTDGSVWAWYDFAHFWLSSTISIFSFSNCFIGERKAKNHKVGGKHYTSVAVCAGDSVDNFPKVLKFSNVLGIGWDVEVGGQGFSHHHVEVVETLLIHMPIFLPGIVKTDVFQWDIGNQRDKLTDFAFNLGIQICRLDRLN